MPEGFDMSIHISTERGEVVVEQQKAGGVTTHKHITPQALCDCFLTSRYDDERHATGLLPDGCIAAVMEKKYVYYFIRYPELYADITYYDTEYRDFPLPRLVFGFQYMPQEGKVAGCRVCVVKDERRLTPDTPTYRYPFSNVHGNNNICTGNNALSVYRDPARLHALASYLLRLPNNNDLYSRDSNRLHAEYRDLLEQMKGKTPSHYYTDVLVEDGKNLLERHLPAIPHEMVLAQLSKATRKALEGENILSPETYLKKKREDIRNLEETIIYLQGQKDQAQTQDENWSKTVDGLSARHDALSRKLAELEAKRFDGLDQAAMGQRLVELSARYDEAARDSSPLDGEILGLERKLAARRAEQYQSQYIREIAEVNAKLAQLYARFDADKKTFQTFAPGMTCPTCRRLITEEALVEVRAALELSAKDAIAAGQEQKAQLKEIQELDAKAKAVFEQFQADDVAKLRPVDKVSPYPGKYDRIGMG